LQKEGVNILFLAFDVGNSRMSLGVFEDDALVHRWALSTDTSRTGEEYAELIDLSLHRRGLAKGCISGIAIANVVPALQRELLVACRVLGFPTPLVVGPGVRTKLKIRFEPPTELGGDRIANAVAAVKHMGNRVVVIDLGTATTFDCVVDGEYVGGVAAPGLQSSFEGLMERASRLPRVELIKPQQTVGRTVVAALQSGLINGHAAMCDGMVDRICQELGDAKVVLTGDMAEIVGSAMRVNYVLEPALTLMGLKVIYDMNRV